MKQRMVDQLNLVAQSVSPVTQRSKDCDNDKETAQMNYPRGNLRT